MLRVLIADDHPLVRRGIGQIIEELPEPVQTGEAGTGLDVLEKVRGQTWDLLILDLSMPELGGLEVLMEIKQICPSLPVLVFSMHPEEQFAWRVMKAGAAGYVSKRMSPDSLIEAVQTVIAGGRYINPVLVEQATADILGTAPKPRHTELTNREFQVLRGLGAGKSMKQIASDLRLSVKSVEAYRAHLLVKLAQRNTAELVRYAITHQLVE